MNYTMRQGSTKIMNFYLYFIKNFTLYVRFLFVNTRTANVTVSWGGLQN